MVSLSAEDSGTGLQEDMGAGGGSEPPKGKAQVAGGCRHQIEVEGLAWPRESLSLLLCCLNISHAVQEGPGASLSSAGAAGIEPAGISSLSCSKGVGSALPWALRPREPRSQLLERECFLPHLLALLGK